MEQSVPLHLTKLPGVAKGLLRGLAEWLFVLGLYAVAREVFTSTYPRLPFFSRLAMPFYLTHQQVGQSVPGANY